MWLNFWLHHFPLTTDTSCFSGHTFIYKHTPVSKCFLWSSQHLPQIYLLLLHNSLPPPWSPPSWRSAFPASDPWPLPLIQEMANMPQKADWSVGLADCQLATHPSPASSFRRWGLFPHDSDPARGLGALREVSYIPCKNFFSLFFNCSWCSIIQIGVLCKKGHNESANFVCRKFMNPQ